MLFRFSNDVNIDDFWHDLLPAPLRNKLHAASHNASRHAIICCTTLTRPHGGVRLVM